MAKRRERASCGCRMRAAYYPRSPGNCWGRVDVSPTCTKTSHREELEALSRSMVK